MHEPLVHQKKKRCCSCWRRLHCGGLFMVLALLFFLLSIILPDVIHEALVSGVYDQVTPTKSAMEHQTDGWKTWADTRQATSKQYMLAWFYNVTNPEEVVQGATPILNETGPYAFTQYTYVQNISFPLSIDGYQLVKFKNWQWLEFNPSLSFPKADPYHDRITIPNLVLLGMYYQSPDLALLAYRNRTEVQRMYATQSPMDWLFGFKDPDTKIDFPGVSPNQTLEQALARDYDQIYTGEDDHSLTRQFYTYQNSATIECTPSRVIPKAEPCWGTSEANRLHGTDGAQFAPLDTLKEGGSASTWVDDLYRTLPLYNTDDETTEVEGIKLHKFKVRKQELQCAANNSNNAQYYAYGLDGYWNVTYSQGLVPTFISMPHLLDANPLMFDYFEGMSPPVRANHETALGVELTTGLTLSARKRWQINFGIKPLTFGKLVKNVTWFKDLKMPPAHESEYLYHPAMWMQLQGDVSSEDASTLKGSVYLAKTLITFFKWGGMAIGIAALFAALAAWLPLLTSPAHKHYRPLDTMA